MASIYKRPNSPFWWLKSAASGEITRTSTRLRWDRVNETRIARELEAEHTLKERQNGPAAKAHAFRLWVPTFLREHYSNNGSYQRYRIVWGHIAAFLDELELVYPAQIQRAHGAAYVAWRKRPHRGRRAARQTTAVVELQIFVMLMNEAVSRRFIPVNPLFRLHLPTPKPREKPELTDAQMDLVLQLIRSYESKHRDLLEHSFLISRYQGCRQAETHLDPFTDVQLPEEVGRDVGTIRFRIKGGTYHTTALAPQLVPLFRRLRAEGRRETFARQIDANGLDRAGTIWANFTKAMRVKEQVPGFCHHCLRVTLITRLARSGVSQSIAMRFVGHANAIIHRHYQRLQAQDVAGVFSSVAAAGR